MTPCIEFPGGRNNRGGYGYRHVNGKKMLAHRLAWVEAHGEIPAGLHVLHRCDNPPCINVDHLFLGTDQDNVTDCVNKGRRHNGWDTRTHCSNGHEYTPENTRITAKGHRVCRRCMVDHQRRYVARQKEMAS